VANQANQDSPEDRIFGGQTDYPLSEEGIEEARALKATWSDLGVHFDRIVSSPLTRATQFCDILGRPYEIDSRFTERGLGKCIL